MSPRAQRLAARLGATGEAALARVVDDDLAGLRGHARDLRAMLGGAGAGAGVTPDRVREQIACFRETGKLADLRAARLVCWGTTLADAHAAPLIEDAESFPVLLDEVDGYRDFKRPFRRCWRGLLDGYLTYDPSAGHRDGARNWEVLRTYLNDNLPVLERQGQRPDWLVAIDDHANILTDDPCGRYGTDLLEGDQSIIDPLRRDLSVGDTSWLMRRMFEAQIDAATRFADGKLRAVMPRLTALIAGHDLLADGGLARILDRYAGCASTDVEPNLRDLAVHRWGNPWLERNDSRWTSVLPETRRMVSSWLKLRLIETFFGLLSEDRLNDQRRIAFWKRYVDRITDMHFALGESAYRNPSPDFRALRKDMKGRLLKLEQGGGSRNNAFIMKMDDHIFVEFGETGNALFAFDADNAPFDLGGMSIAGNRTALKHPNYRARMIHMDGGGERWERKIERKIAQLVGRGRAAPAQAPGIHRTAPAGPVWRNAGMPSGAAVAPRRDDVAALVERHGLRTDDYRDRGGALWAHAPRNGAATSDLRRHGFIWSQRRGAWYRKS